MDNHPIPQDVTGFQFKLLGSMTIKQFGYVLCGVILAVILYYLPLKSALGILFKTIFIPLIGGSGFVLAFIPIEGRPFDVMISNFIRALFAPNQFVYQKTGRLFSFSAVPAPKTLVGKTPVHTQTATNSDKTRQLQQLLNASHVQKQNPLDAKEATFLQAFPSPHSSTPLQPVIQSQPALQQQPIAQPQPVLQQQPIQQQQPLPPAPQPSSQTPETLAKEEQLLNEQLHQAQKEEQEQVQQARGATSEAHQKALMLERQVQTLHFQRQQLEEQLAYLKKQLDAQKEPAHPSAPLTATTSPAAPAPVQQTPQQSIAAPQSAGKQIGLPHTPDTPNVIAGIVRDPRGNVLPNILVEVKDKDGNPVRAFKTNARGQFASATPLTSGYYTVELEDPKKLNTFNIIQLAATNQILLPIEIISHDAREELRKQLFN